MNRTLSQIQTQEIIDLVPKVNSYSKLLKELGCTKNGGNQEKIKKIIEDLNLNVDHFIYGKRNSKKNYCLVCGKEIGLNSKFCSNECSTVYKNKIKVEKWKAGKLSGTIGSDNIATFVRKYLFNKYNNACQCCGWNKVNPYTNLIPLQIHHIDGDCLNNKEDNLQLLCPNCHSLTENFGSRNKNATRIDKRVR